MQFTASTSSLLETTCDVVVTTLGSDASESRPADEALTEHAIELRDAGIVDSALGAINLTRHGDHTVMIVGAGSKPLSRAQHRKLWESAGRALRRRRFDKVVVDPGANPVDSDDAYAVRQTVLGLEAGHYRYSATRKLEGAAAHEVKEIVICGADASTVRETAAIALGVATSRELGNLPPNLLNPATFAERASELAAKYDSATAQILQADELEAMGMGALIAVGQGSATPPRLIVLRYQGGSPDDAPIALVGKGITFDTGGISLKPGAAMDEMKFDMCGAAGVVGAFQICCELELPINLVTVVPAVENMPDGKSYRPGDVVTTLAGKTVEVLNTDAEGRLILCDALTYTQNEFKPRVLIDAATLTGACVVALGKHACGLMSKHDDLAGDLLAAGDRVFDRAWRLPLWDEYQSQLDSKFADFSNLGGPPAGSITAGCFLARFCENAIWAHLDVAGTAWEQGKNKGATGRPAGLLGQYLIDQAAKKDGQ